MGTVAQRLQWPLARFDDRIVDGGTRRLTTDNALELDLHATRACSPRSIYLTHPDLDGSNSIDRNRSRLRVHTERDRQSNPDSSASEGAEAPVPDREAYAVSLVS